LSINPEIYRMMRGLTCLVFFLSFQANAQNLLGNKGFEERNICSEYQVKCAPEAWFFFPIYTAISPREPDSNHYEVIFMGKPRDEFTVGKYIYTKLLCQLQANVKYRISFRIHIPTFAFDYLDLWFVDSEPGRNRRTSVFTAKPTYSITPDSVTGNRKGWMQVNYTFTAKGDERFLMLGNFQHAELKKARKSSRKKWDVEYWIDDIGLLPADPSVPLCPQYEAIKDQLYRNNARHPARFIENIRIDSSLIAMPPKKDTVVAVNPVTPPVIVQPKTDTLIIPDVLFEFNSSKLKPAFAKRLDSLGNKLAGLNYSKLLIAGHTDNVGSDEYNFTLSSERAITIKNYFVAGFRLDGTLIETAGFGESQPRATNNTATGRQQNRRVEIIIYYK
jgi:outer membrane protein OmpA-like peptidoglycan-associated protein